MQWFTWFETVLAHVCGSRQHEAPFKGHDSLSRPKIESRACKRMMPNRTRLERVWAAHK